MYSVLRRRLQSSWTLRRLLSSDAAKDKAGLVLGVYKDGTGISLTPSAQKFDATTNSRLSNLLSVSHMTGARQRGGVRLLYGMSDEYPCVAAVGLGECGSDVYDTTENLHSLTQNVREAVSEGVLALQGVQCSRVTVDECSQPRAAAEGAALALWRYDELKQHSEQKPRPLSVQLSPRLGDSEEWRTGLALAEGQNLARTLMETPANLMTPTIFCKRVGDLVSDLDVEVCVRDRTWIEQQKMGAFLAVARGSREEPRLLELIYRGASAERSPLALVGKGVTFDSGGISLKPSSGMDKMRADMGGAACVAGAIYTAARLTSKVNLHAFIPLCENMPGGAATRPGDVVHAGNGTSIQIDNTDAEGRLILADALVYAQTFKPAAIIDVATLTGAMAVALGSAGTGVFSNSDSLWHMLESAGAITGDRVWRMPLWKHYTDKIKKCRLADLNNIGGDRYAGACTAAAFLREFVSADTAWMHLDIAGVMESGDGEGGGLSKGMSGRPTRTLVTFTNNFFQS